MLNFGCGEGANIKYLKDIYKFDTYGADISKKVSIQQKKYSKNRFSLTKSKVDKTEKFFHKKFDLILSLVSYGS